MTTNTDAVTISNEAREAVCIAVAEALGGALDCLRTWSAWGIGTMREDDFSNVADDAERVAEIADAAINAMTAQPIPMILFCPKCGTQHIDAPEPEQLETFDSGADIEYIRRPAWTNPPHRSHLCYACKTVWRPADVATVGVAAIITKGSADTWDADAKATTAKPLKRGRMSRQEKIDESREIVAAKLQRIERPLSGRCAAVRDGDCSHSQCPQLRDGEPMKSGRHCPLDVQEEEY